MKDILVLVSKDLKIELRSKDTLVLYSTLGILLSVIIAAGASAAFVNQSAIISLFPSFLWIVFLLAGSYSVSKLQEIEFRNSVHQRMLVLGLNPASMFIAKAISTSIFIAAGFLVSLVALSTLLNVEIVSFLSGLTLLGILAAFGFASLSVLLSCIALKSRVSALLLPLMILPLLFPMFYALIELTGAYLNSGESFFSSMWFTLLIGLDVLYAAIGMSLYIYVLKE
ncbi:MAG: hypothetical protein KDD56_00970 [Bdellovibrionales bacterium]|nr:hypothetical protein [Bdellovibrionales bacterium]